MGTICVSLQISFKASLALLDDVQFLIILTSHCIQNYFKNLFYSEALPAE